MNRKVMKKILDTKLGTLTFYAVVMPVLFLGVTTAATILWLGSKKA